MSNGRGRQKPHYDDESGSVEIKLKRHLATKFRLINGIGDNFGVTVIVL